MRTHFNVFSAPAVNPFVADPLAGFSRIFSDLLPTDTEGEWTTFPPFDVRETKDAYELELDVPGLKKEDIKLELKENRLTISGERKRVSTADKEATLHRVERSFGKFRRELAFGTEVDAEKVEARYEDGVLWLSIPKVEAKKPHLIAIK